MVWEPSLCVHSGICVRGLPKVFDTAARPWIQPANASVDAVVTQVELCPSGALRAERT